MAAEHEHGQGGSHHHPHDDHAHRDQQEHHHDHPGGIRGVLATLFHPHSHDPADSVDDALESSAAGIRAVKVSLVVLAVTACAQLALFWVTDSVALLADTIHNFSDALSALPLWVAFVLAGRAPTRRHTYGFGRAEDLAGVFIVVLILLSAVLSGFESIRRLVDPQPVSHPWVILLAGVIGFLGNEAVAAYRVRVGRRIASAALVADGVHARADGFTSLAVALGAIGVLLGFPLADALVGLLITVAILLVMRGAATEVFGRLMDAVDPALVDRAEAALVGVPGVVSADRVRLRWIGHRLQAEADLVVAHDLTVWEGHEVAVAAEHALLHGVARLDRATVHVSPSHRAGQDPHAPLAHHPGTYRAPRPVPPADR